VGNIHQHTPDSCGAHMVRCECGNYTIFHYTGAGWTNNNRVTWYFNFNKIIVTKLLFLINYFYFKLII